MNPLDRAERRRAARQALTAALAGLDKADKQALLEDALADSYAAREAIAHVPGMAGVAVAEMSMARRVVDVLLREPSRTFTIEDVATAIGATGRDLQRVRSELSRQARQGNEIESPGRAQYRARSSETGGKSLFERFQLPAESAPPPIPKDEPAPIPPPIPGPTPPTKRRK